MQEYDEAPSLQSNFRKDDTFSFEVRAEVEVQTEI